MTDSLDDDGDAPIPHKMYDDRRRQQYHPHRFERDSADNPAGGPAKANDADLVDVVVEPEPQPV
jgi:hypothetical protein